MPDFGLAQIPNFASSALGGYQAGQAMGRQQQVQSALSGIDLTRPETLTPLLKVDPEHGIALLGASSAMLKNEREIAARQATTDYLTARFAPKPATAAAPSVSTDGTTVATAAPAATGTAPTLTGTPDTSAAEHALMQADPQGYLKLRESVDAMDEKQRARLVEAQDAIHGAAAAAADLPYAQRKAYIASRSNDLAAHYVTPEMIAGFDPTDENINGAINEALGVKGVAERADKRAQLAETARHNRISEGQGAARIGVAQGALAVAKGRAAKAAGGGAADTSDLSYLMGGN